MFDLIVLYIDDNIKIYKIIEIINMKILLEYKRKNYKFEIK